MSKILSFPHKLHDAFFALVKEGVSRTAEQYGCSIEDYINVIYYSGEDPDEFTDTESLTVLYRKFRELIENRLNYIDIGQLVSDSQKAYLCYRIYLHSMTIERKVMTEEEAKEQLVMALREYFYSVQRILQLPHEMQVMKMIEEYCELLPAINDNSCTEREK